jgi:hypothetical protein
MGKFVKNKQTGVALGLRCDPMTCLKGQSHGKVCEIINLSDRLGPNLGSPTFYKILKSPM